jgi:hypothetical protein
VHGLTPDAGAAFAFYLLWHSRYGGRSGSGALVSEHQLRGAVIRHETRTAPDGPVTRITFGRTKPSGVVDWDEGTGCYGGLRLGPVGRGR